MSRLSISELTTYRWSFDEDLLYAKKTGYDAIGLWRRKLADFGCERGLELLDESGLAVSSVNWAGGFTGNDGRSQAECLADARAAVRLTSLVGADRLLVYTGGHNNHTRRHAERLVTAAIDELLPIAEEHGVTLLLKPMHPRCAEEWTTLTKLDAAAEFVSRFDTARLQLAYDTYHFPMEGDARTFLADLAPSLGLVQLADARRPHSIDQDRCALGEGRVAIAETIHELLAAGYQGDFEVELMGAEIESADYESLLADSNALVREAIEGAKFRPTPAQASHPVAR